MPRYLVDSDVIIWALRRQPQTTDLLISLSREEVLACSAVNVLEVELGTRPSEIATVRQHLSAYEILPVDTRIAQQAAELLRSSGRPPHRGEWADAVIAATALVHGLTIVTYNQRHYPYAALSLYPL